MTSSNGLRDRYERVMERIAQAAQRAGRRREEIIAIAVTKLASPDQIRRLIELGHRDFGENKVQQMQQRSAMIEEFLQRHRTMSSARRTNLPDEIRWHMVGHLQRNKVKTLLPLSRLIHGVDTLRLAEEIQTQASKRGEPAEVLLQVNVSREQSKHGAAVAAIAPLAEQMQTMDHVRLRGLMTIAPYSENPEDSRPVFERLSELFREIGASSAAGDDFNILSMGMTNDFELAIECGANMVRIGRAIFEEPAEAPAAEHS